MKKFIYCVCMSALICACTKTVEIVDPYSSGVCVGEILLGTVGGNLTLSVETKGTWRVESDQPWLKLDINGYNGDGAFTVSYTSNLSDVIYIKKERTAKVTIRLEETMKTDTLIFVQRGMQPVEAKRKVHKDPDLNIEYNPVKMRELVLLCCSSDGDAEVLDAFLESQNADIEVVGKNPNLKDYEGPIEVRGFDFKGYDSDQEYEEFRNLIRSTYNSSPDAGDYWIYAGQMYNSLSVMQTNYSLTPDWYPRNTDDACFRADRYAWQNNLYDCAWMYMQNYVQTWTDEDGRSFCADFVYVSASVLALISSVEIMDVPGLSHKPVKVTLKY